MADELSQDELDKLTEDSAGAGGLADDQVVGLAGMLRPPFDTLADALGERLGRDVAIEFAAAKNGTGADVTADVEASGLFVHFLADIDGTGNHGLIIGRPEAAALGALLTGGEPAGDAVTAEGLDALTSFLGATLPAAAAALQESSGGPVEFGPPQAVHTDDPSVEFDPAVLSLDGPVLLIELVLEGGEGLSGAVRYVLPTIQAQRLLDRAAQGEDEDAELQKPVFADFESAGGGAQAPPSGENIGLIMDIQLNVTARLGSVQMPIREILKLAPGSIIDIDRPVDAPVELVVNDKLVAKGDVVVVQENFGLKISEVQSPQERIASLRP